MSSDADAITTASLVLCLKRQGITAGPKNGTDEDHSTHTHTHARTHARTWLREPNDHRSLSRLDGPSFD